MCSYLSNHRLDTKVAHINLDDKWSKSDVTPKSIMLIDWSFILMIQHKVVHLCVHYHPAQIRTVGNRRVHRQKITEKVICHFGDQSASSISATNHRRRRKFCIRHNLTQSHMGTYYWSSNTSTYQQRSKKVSATYFVHDCRITRIMNESESEAGNEHWSLIMKKQWIIDIETSDWLKMNTERS